MDDTTLWVNAINIFTSIATFGALVAVIIEIKSSKATERRNASFELQDKWQALADDRQIFQGLTWHGAEEFNERFPPGSRERIAYANISNFYETLGESAFNGLLDKEMAFVNWGELANQNWSKSMDIVHKDRGKTRPLLLAYLRVVRTEIRKAAAKTEQ